MNKFWLTGDKFMSELHLKQPGFTYNTCEPFTKHQRIWKFKETGNIKHLFRNESYKACFPHDVGYSHSKDLAKRTISDKILKNRVYETGRSHNYNGYQRALASMVCKFFY